MGRRRKPRPPTWKACYRLIATDHAALYRGARPFDPNQNEMKETTVIASIVRTVAPDAVCSYPRGKREVYFLAPYSLQPHAILTATTVRLEPRGRTWEETIRQANLLAETFQSCCHVDGITYSVELVEDDSPDRAPE